MPKGRRRLTADRMNRLADDAHSSRAIPGAGTLLASGPTGTAISMIDDPASGGSGPGSFWALLGSETSTGTYDFLQQDAVNGPAWWATTSGGVSGSAWDTFAQTGLTGKVVRVYPTVAGDYRFLFRHRNPILPCPDGYTLTVCVVGKGCRRDTNGSTVFVTRDGVGVASGTTSGAGTGAVTKCPPAQYPPGSCVTLTIAPADLIDGNYTITVTDPWGEVYVYGPYGPTFNDFRGGTTGCSRFPITVVIRHDEPFPETLYLTAINNDDLTDPYDVRFPYCCHTVGDFVGVPIALHRITDPYDCNFEYDSGPFGNATGLVRCCDWNPFTNSYTNCIVQRLTTTRVRFQAACHATWHNYGTTCIAPKRAVVACGNGLYDSVSDCYGDAVCDLCSPVFIRGSFQTECGCISFIITE